MRIKFKKDDPRAGTIVDMEEGVARAAIERGEAEEVTGKAATTEADRAQEAAAPAATPAAARAAKPARAAAKKAGRRG